MLFNSYSFMLFFPVVLCIYFVIPKKARHLWLLVASYYFYMGWNAKYALLIAASTIITYLGGLFIERRKEKKKWCLIGVICINLLILFFFKYYDFALDNINRILSFAGYTMYLAQQTVIPLSVYAILYAGLMIDLGIGIYKEINQKGEVADAV